MKSWILLLIISSFLIVGCSKNIDQNGDSRIVVDDVTTRLINIENHGYIESAGYYEASLELVDISGEPIYLIFMCSKEELSWVADEKYCYRFNWDEVQRNVESHKYSAELSGCYIGNLERVSCEQ